MTNNLISIDNYKYESWKEKFPDNNIDIFSDLEIDKTWVPVFDQLKKDNRIKDINETIKKCTETNKEVFPYPKLVFEAFKRTPLNKVKVCIIGQDCYFNKQKCSNGLIYPEAMGLSFSVPNGVPIPSSLSNIFKNAVKFKNMTSMPTNGNLQSWADQGCLLINAALTVQHYVKNSHADIWSWFTDYIIKQISETNNHVVFVLWGRFALNKMSLIDTKKHKIVASSHPSGLSVNNKMGNFPSFSSLDQFGTVNKYLKELGEQPINWNLAEEKPVIKQTLKPKTTKKNKQDDDLEKAFNELLSR